MISLPHSDPLFPGDMPLDEVRDRLREMVKDGKGHDCPVCTRRVQVYKRNINATMARSLIAMWRAWGHEFGHLPTLRPQAALHHSNQEASLAWWGLIEEEKVRRPDGGRAGYWRVTDLGGQWIRGEVTVPKFARHFNRRCLQVLGEPWSIHDALGTRFDWRATVQGTLHEEAS
jgi:hypothetical protein